MKRKYFLFLICLVNSLGFWLCLFTVGNVNAQSAAIGEKPIDTVSYVEKNAVFLKDKSKIFFAAGTSISNHEEITNAEFVLISDNVNKTKADITISDTKKTQVHKSNITLKKETHTQEYQVVKKEVLLDVSQQNPDNFFSNKKSFQNVILPQNILGKQNVILSKQLSPLISFVSECYIDYVFIIQIPENLYSDTPFIRPPPII